MSKHTQGEIYYRFYANDASDLAELEKRGIEPLRMLTNEGQIALMCGTGEQAKRVALLDCQTKYKRGEGYKSKCEERDANAEEFKRRWNSHAALMAIYEATKDLLDNGFEGESYHECPEFNVEKVEKVAGLIESFTAALTADKLTSRFYTETNGSESKAPLSGSEG